jgi:hypothetical protein
MLTVKTLGDSLMRRQYKLRKKAKKGRPDLWTIGLLKSNAKRVRTEER